MITIFMFSLHLLSCQPVTVDVTKNLQIRMIEQQIMFLKQQLETVRQTGKKKRKKKNSKSRRSSKSSAVESSSTPKPPAPKKVKEPRPKPTPKPPAPPKEVVVREITFEEKRELSELINQLDGDKLEHVVQIIRENLKDLPNVS